MSQSANAAVVKTVIFTREHKDGLQSSTIHVDHDLLVFVNDEATKPLQVGGEYLIEWEIVGPTGSSLVVAKRYAGEDPSQAAAIVNSTIRAQDNGHRQDFKLFKA